ncbi:uncharacterized protein LOC116259270 isoform X2 [Nymphaea colorata]|uniref:uncharacterized protein LOC116259270 isoform X2 n=1 Tax=Nymphaea colorata TaxID=210225 RepID=UPI00129E1CCC|nr:uncharacterized protein LOC116259270 isoform X2 [Nymphaea colorata]
MVSATRSNRFRRLWRKIRNARVSVRFTMVDEEAKKTPTSGEKLIAGGDHGKEIRNSIPISDSSSEEFIQLEASDLGSPSRTLDSGKANMEVLPQSEEPIDSDQKGGSDGGRKNSSKTNSDSVQLITGNQRDGGDELSVSIEAGNVLNDNPSTSSSSSLSPVDVNVEDKTSTGFKVENGELVVQTSAEESYMIKSELPHEANHLIVEHKDVLQTDNHSSYLGFAEQSHLCQAISEAETYDPGRIPSSVFSRHQSSMDVEWSVASNESMFSIQVGSASFSRDHVFNFSKSGDLNGLISGPGHSITPEKDTASGDQSPDICSDQNAAPAAIVPETFHDDIESEKASPIGEQQPEVHAISSPEHAPLLQENIVGGGTLPTTLAVPRTTSMARPSDSSGASIQSFAFPILTAGSKNPSLKVQDEAPVPPPSLPQVKPMEQRGWWCCWKYSWPACC